MMRVLAPAILTTLTVLAAAPANAQTYGGGGPVCLEYYQWGGGRSVDCSYSSMAQCQATASGLSATCSLNPYLSNGQAPRGRAYRQPRRSY